MQTHQIRIPPCLCVLILAVCAAFPAADVAFANDAGPSPAASFGTSFDQARIKIAGTDPAENNHAEEAVLFTELWSQATEGNPDFGPYAGTIAHLPNEVSVADPDVSVSDFAAHIVCRLPDDQNPTVHWDCGFEFRGIAEQPHYRLVVSSRGYWVFLAGQSQELAGGEGLAPLAGQRLTIDLVAVGAEALFAVNGEFVAKLDIAGIPGPGTVAAGTSFYRNTTIPDGSTRFEEFSIWSIGPAAKSRAAEVIGNTYTSPSHGFRLSWDDSWFISPVALGAGEELALTSERAAALVSTTSGQFSAATECFAGIIEKYENDPAYSAVAIFTNEGGEKVMTPGDKVASALLHYEYTVNDGQLTTEAFDYVLCAMLPDRGTIVQLEQFVPADGFITEKGEMESLQESLEVVDGEFIVPPGLPAFTLGEASPGADDRAAFDQLRAEIGHSPQPSLAPARLELEMPGPEFAVWNAGVSISDFALHAELASATSTDAGWELSIEFRSVDSMSQYVSITSDATFSTFDVEGTLDTTTPSSIDLIVVGQEGYVALDGGLIAVLGLEDWMVAGDIVFTAVSTDQPEGSNSVLTVESLSIIDLDGGISYLFAPPSGTSVR